MTDYIKQVNQDGGVATMDVNVSDAGKVYLPHLKQLLAIRKGVRTP